MELINRVRTSVRRAMTRAALKRHLSPQIPAPVLDAIVEREVQRQEPQPLRAALKIPQWLRLRLIAQQKARAGLRRRRKGMSAKSPMVARKHTETRKAGKCVSRQRRAPVHGGQSYGAIDARVGELLREGHPNPSRQARKELYV